MLFIFGIGRNITALLVYVLYEFNQGLSHFTQNGGDNLMKFTLLYMVFANSFQHFSVDSKKENGVISNTLSNLAGYSVQIHVCLAYFYLPFTNCILMYGLMVLQHTIRFH
jgi:hypothetical protein